MTDHTSHKSDADWEDVLRSQLQHYEAEPPADLWADIERDLGRGRVVPLYVRWGGAAAAIAVLAVGIGLWNEIHNETEMPTVGHVDTQPTHTGAQLSHAATPSPQSPASSVASNKLPSCKAPALPEFDSKTTDSSDVAEYVVVPDDEYIVNNIEERCEDIADITTNTDTLTGADGSEENYYFVHVTNGSQNDTKELSSTPYTAEVKPTRDRFKFSLYVASGGIYEGGHEYYSDIGSSTIHSQGGSPGHSSEITISGNPPTDTPTDDGNNDKTEASSQHRMPLQLLTSPNQQVYGHAYNHNIPIKTAALFRWSFSRRLDLNAGLSYTFLQSDFYYHGATSLNYWNGRQRVHFLGLPVSLSYSLLDRQRWSIYVSGGGEVAKAVGVQWRGHRGQHAKATAHPWQTSVSAAFGIQYNLARHVGLYFQPSADYYIRNNSGIETYYTEHPFTPSLQIGLRFKL